MRTTPHLFEMYQDGELTLPYSLPEPNAFRGEGAVVSGKSFRFHDDYTPRPRQLAGLRCHA